MDAGALLISDAMRRWFRRTKSPRDAFRGTASSPSLRATRCASGNLLFVRHETILQWRRRRCERGTACGATGGGTHVPVAPIDGADGSEVAEERVIVVEVDVERWVGAGNRARACCDGLRL